MSQHRGSIYAYTTPAYRDTRWTGRRRGRGLIKVGYTTRDPHVRIREQIGASSPEKDPYTLLLTAKSVSRSGKSFSDKDVHRILRSMGVRNVHNEWFEAEAKDIREALERIDAKSVRRGRRPVLHKGRSPRLRRFKTWSYAAITCGILLSALFPHHAKSVIASISTILLELPSFGA